MSGRTPKCYATSLNVIMSPARASGVAAVGRILRLRDAQLVGGGVRSQG